MVEYPKEGVLRGGHIPGAKNVPWARAANADGSFKSADELRQLYERDAGLKKADDVVAYCRIGERSSHTWFVLSYLLGKARRRTSLAHGPAGGTPGGRRLKSGGGERPG